MAAVIICNGSIGEYSYYTRYLDNADLIICADGGAVHAKKFGIKPDVLLGDFDSIPEADFKFFKDLGVEILKFPTEKDMTDTELAIQLAVDRGHRSIVIIGGLGTRFDHSLSNVMMLKSILDRGAVGTIINEFNEITLIEDSIEIKKEKGVKVTLLPLSERVEGITTKGMYYPLRDATIEMGSTRGVSNEIVDEFAQVTLSKGLLLVIKSRD